MLVIAAALALLVIGVAVTLGSTQWVPRLAYLIVGLMFLDLSPVSTAAGSNLRLYQPLSLLLVAAPAARHFGAVKRGPLVKWLVAFSIGVAVSLEWTVSWTDTIGVTLGQLFLMYLFVIYGSLLHRRIITPSGVLSALRIGATTTSAVALLQFVLAYLGLQWQIFDVAGIPWHRPSGLMREPDWAGLAAAIGLIFQVLREKGARGRRRGLAICALVVLLTAVRAVFASFAVVGIVSFLSGRKATRLSRFLFPVGFLLVCGLFVVGVVNPSALARFTPNTILSSTGDGGSANSRLGIIHLVQDHVNLFGHGAGSLAYESTLSSNAIRYAGGGSLNAGRGSTNLFYSSLWDLGIVGLVLMVCLVLSWLRVARRASLSYPAIMPVTVLILVDFQFNNGLRFGFVWLLMAVASWVSGESYFGAKAAKGRLRGQVGATRAGTPAAP